MGQVQFLSATTVAAFRLIASNAEGLLFRRMQRVRGVLDLAPGKPKDHLMVVNMSGRGDKDLDSVAAFLSARGK